MEVIFESNIPKCLDTNSDEEVSKTQSKVNNSPGISKGINENTILKLKNYVKKQLDQENVIKNNEMKGVLEEHTANFKPKLSSPNSQAIQNYLKRKAEKNILSEDPKILKGKMEINSDSTEFNISKEQNSSIWGIVHGNSGDNKKMPPLIPAGMYIGNKKSKQKKEANKKENSKSEFVSKTQINKSKYERPSNSLKSPDSKSSPTEKAQSSNADFETSTEASKNNSGYNSEDDHFDDHNIKTVIGCQCVQCLRWNSKETSEDVKPNFISEPKPKVNIEKPMLLFKSGEDTDEIEIKSHASTKIRRLASTTKVERSVAPKILVHGSTIPAPAEHVLSTSFESEIHKSLLSLHFQEARQVQTYVWPALMRRMNAFIVGGPKSGKTMAYVPAVCTYIQEKQNRYLNLPKKEWGPIAVILCKGCEVAEEVFDLTQKMFDSARVKPYMALAIPPLDKSRLRQFTKCCDVLVATPLTLTSLLRSRIVNLKRLCHLIVEEGDILLDRFSKEMDIIFGVTQNMLEHRICNYSVQMVITSEKWTIQLEKLLRTLYCTPIVCIGNSLEAALYGRVDLEVCFFKEQRKKSFLVEILKDKVHFHKAIVICNTEEEIDGALEYLRLNSIGAVAATSKNSKEEIYEYETSWINSDGHSNIVLLCTNEIFNRNLDITNATLLIHYSLPSSWTLFSYRFRSMIDSYKSPLSKRKLDDVTYCKSYIFVDQNCRNQFPRLVRLLQRMNKTLSPKYMEYYSKELEKIEEDKINKQVDICKNLKLFGECVKTNCSRRHAFSNEIDSNNYLPKSGIIRFQILYIHDVTTFSIKLLEHTDSDGNVKRDWGNYEEMEKGLMSEINIEFDSADEYLIGNMYAIHDDNRFKRCIITHIIEEDVIQRTPRYVAIKLIDYGSNIKINTWFLYDIPDKFKAIPPRAINLYLVNLIPPDSDEKWSSDCKTKLKKLLNDADYENQQSYFVSQILLQLGDTFWVKNIHLLEKLDACDTVVTKVNIKKILKDLKLVDETEKPLQILYELCRKAEIALPDYNRLPKSYPNIDKKVQEQIKPQWAFLSEDIDYDEVYFCAANSPDEFYIRLKKFDGLFQQMQKEIQSLVRRPFYPEEFEVKEGNCYLAKDTESNEYCRVLVTNIKDDMADCFFVDFGDMVYVNKNELKFLGNDYIMKLPFQVIECRLYGIQSPVEHWQMDATDILYEYSLEPGTDFFQILYTSVKNKGSARMTGGQKFSILLLNHNKDKTVIINKLMIDCGMAVALEQEELNLDINLLKLNIEENQDEEEEELSNSFEKDNTEYVSNEINSFNGSCNSSDAEVFDKEFFIETMLGIKLSKTPQQHPKETLERTVPILKALPPSEHLTPSLTWYQEDIFVHINILLPCVENYDIKLSRERFLNFRTTDENGKQYILNLSLYGKVQNDLRHTSHLSVKVTLKKVNNVDWPRLVSTTNPQRHIKYDVSRIKVIEEEKRPFLKLDIEDEYCDENEIVIGSDEDYSESDVESSCS